MLEQHKDQHQNQYSMDPPTAAAGFGGGTPHHILDHSLHGDTNWLGLGLGGALPLALSDFGGIAGTGSGDLGDLLDAPATAARSSSPSHQQEAGSSGRSSSCSMPPMGPHGRVRRDGNGNSSGKRGSGPSGLTPAIETIHLDGDSLSPTMRQLLCSTPFAASMRFTPGAGMSAAADGAAAAAGGGGVGGGVGGDTDAASASTRRSRHVANMLFGQTPSGENLLLLVC